MLGKILPILLALIGLGAGVGAGIALRPEPDPMAMDNPCGDVHHEEDEHMEEPKEEDDEAESGDYDYVKLNNQFVVPVVRDGRIGALVVMSLSLEVELGQNEAVYRMEPKLRDTFLQVLFDHANAGGFEGAFTKSARMDILRTSLLEAAQSTLGSTIADVLITDVVRQDA
ncbi:hypothetical protein AIOL_004187 [Candidatus Rhodobacter oscarellae]|uniref:Flagellar protein FliL n=1 Tax=Candidatus Rhodobacter oscarellae TaxID=1675527 RepID=A0A0J9E9A2_9RHOB|nr:flagellar basal body-associated FliL family protein [Candidatus Rhodobacter lobularis]KMW59206.1 hypothetical protein AIOL_004187 [Candidatus Rhodobacter lobularis]